MRIRFKADFAALRHARRFTYGNLRFVYQPNMQEHARLGLAVSRKYGNAVRRNKLKRRLRETFRISSLRSLGVDLLVIPIAGWKQGNAASRDMLGGMEKIEKAMCRG